MYYFLTAQTKRRLIDELKNYWSYDPKFRSIVNSIQGSYAYEDGRPHAGIVVKVSSANAVMLSADHYQGVVNSYVYLTRVKDKPGMSVEWVGEDGRAIQANAGRFPSDPGIYFLDIQAKVDPISREETGFQFYVDQLLEVRGESPLQTGATTYQLNHGGLLAQSLRVLEMPARYPLTPEDHYTVDTDTGVLTLVRELSSKQSVLVDYRYTGVVGAGPYDINPGYADNQAVPGCVIGFGNSITVGDQLAVVVQPRRDPAALEYGGRWNLSVEMDIWATDADAQQTLADRTVMFLWTSARPRLSFEGLEITEISLSGEAEEVKDDTEDTYFHTAQVSLSLEADWSLRVPLILTLRALPMGSSSNLKEAALLEDEAFVNQFQHGVQILDSLGLEMVAEPFGLTRFGFPDLR